MKRIWVLYALTMLLGAALAGYALYVHVSREQSLSLIRSGTSSQKVTIGKTIVDVSVVNTPEARTRGLSGRKSLGDSEGMLFVFPEDGVYSFWMKEMHFSIDIIWISSGGDIVHIVENASPESYPTPFTPKSTARYVLKLPAGFVKAHSIAVGEHVAIRR